MKRRSDYQGWTNYETWAIALWIDNDQGSQEYWHEIAREYSDGNSAMEDESSYRGSTVDLADALKSEFEEMNPLSGDASVFSDLMGAALREVDWRKIAASLIEDSQDY